MYTEDKLHSLQETVEKFIKDGDSLSVGGFTTNRKPYPLIHEIIRQGRKDLCLIGGPAGGEMDMLIGAGCCSIYINSYTANSGYSNVGRRYRDAIEKGKVLFEDYSLDVQSLMFHAAAIGTPFIAVKHMLGSDLVEKWGISEETRKQYPKLPNKKVIITEDPFSPGEKVCLVPAVDLDVAIIMVQKASPSGTIRIEGSFNADIDIASSARKTIVCAEEIVTDEELCRDPQLNQIPSFCVDAVVHAPFGSHPSQLYNYYDYDSEYLRMYDKASASDEAFEAFLKEWVFDTKDHEGYLEKLGISRLNKLRICKGVGFSI